MSTEWSPSLEDLTGDPVVGAIRNLASHGDYKVISDVLREARDLRGENVRLAAYSRDMLEECRKLRNELEAKEPRLASERIPPMMQHLTEKKHARVRVQGLEDGQAQFEADAVNRQHVVVGGEDGEYLGLGLGLDNRGKKTDQADFGLRLQHDKAEVGRAPLTGAMEPLEKEGRDLARIQKTIAIVEVDAKLRAPASTSLLDKKITKLEGTYQQEGCDLFERTNDDGSSSQLGRASADPEEDSRELNRLAGCNSTDDKLLRESCERLKQEQDGKRMVQQDLQVTRQSLQKAEEKTGALTDEVARLRRVLQEQKTEIVQVREKATKTRASLDRARVTIKALEKKKVGLEQELQAKSVRLDELDRYRVKLRDEPQESCVKMLDTIWLSVLALAEKHFSQDLDASVLNDPSCWRNLGSSKYLGYSAPLPLLRSNSRTAKQMRTAALLAVLSRSLAKHIFRPWYLIEDEEEELVQILRSLEASSPAQELQVRATLLGIRPGWAEAAAARRVRAVVREVGFLVQHLLSALQYAALCTALEESCGLACRQWRRLQTATVKVEPFFGPPYDDFDWQVLSLPRAFWGGSGGGGLDAKSVQTVVVDPAEIMLVLWPTMCVVERGELVSILQGMVMTKKQAAAALEEQEEARWLARRRSQPAQRRSTTIRRRSLPPILPLNN